MHNENDIAINTGSGIGINQMMIDASTIAAYDIKDKLPAVDRTRYKVPSTVLS